MSFVSNAFWKVKVWPLTFWSCNRRLIFIKKVLILKQWYFFPKIVLTYCEIPRTIYSNSERSEQFVKQNVCSWRFFRSNILEQLDFIFEKILGFRNLQEKLEKSFFSNLQNQTVQWPTFGLPSDEILLDNVNRIMQTFSFAKCLHHTSVIKVINPKFYKAMLIWHTNLSFHVLKPIFQKYVEKAISPKIA